MSLQKLVPFIERHIDVDGEHQTVIPGLALFRASSVSEHNASVYVPCLCVVAQGAKEVVIGGEPYRYDPSHSLLVSLDLPATSRVVEASPKRPCLVARIDLNLGVVGEMLAENATPSTTKSDRALALAPMTAPLFDAIERLVALPAPPRIEGRARGYTPRGDPQR